MINTFVIKQRKAGGGLFFNGRRAMAQKNILL